MALFGNKKGGSIDWASRLARAQALMQGDYMGAARLTGAMQDNALAREKAERERQQALTAELDIRSGLEKRGYSQDDINVLMSNPKVASELVAESLKTRQFGSSGGSLLDPVTGQWTMAP